MHVFDDSLREELPAPLAFPFARATSLGAGPGASSALAAAIAEYASVVALSRAIAAGPLDTRVEEALAATLNTEPGPRDWRALLEALGGDAPALDGSELVAALEAWPGRRIGLAHVASVRAEGGGAVVRWRRLHGTAWPQLREDRVADAPTPGVYLLPSGAIDGERVAVPDWLGLFDEERLVVRLFAGRGAGGRWRYVTTHPAADRVVLLAVARPGTPIWLRGLMPADGPRSDATGDAPTLHSLNADDVARGVAEHLARVNPATPPIAPAVVEPAGRLVLRVVAGRQLLSFAGLAPGRSLVVGRSASSAQLVVHQGEVSRAHVRVVVDDDGAVRACDLGSANGTLLDDRPLTRELAPLPVGGQLRIGPVVLRLERLGDDLVERLERIAAFQRDSARDPLTSLLQPTAVYADLPAVIEGAARVSGAVLDVDRLGALHAQLGQDVADAVFHAVAKLVMFTTPRPELCVRLNYGRILVVLPGIGADAALELLAPITDLIGAHRWAPERADEPKVTLSGAVGELGDGEAPDTWVMRLGTGLNQGRLDRGRNRIFAI